MKKIFVAGHNGMVGSAICRKLRMETSNVVLTCSRSELDLCDPAAVQNFMESEKPDEVILAAAKVGGIHANNVYPADFIYENLQIQNSVIHAAHKNNVQKLLFLGSSCIYPREALQPMSEEALLTNTLEPTNEPYAIAKIAGIKMCESYNRQYGRDYRSVMPTNLYGPGDNYHSQNGHVISALIRRFHEAKKNNSKEVVVWGSGKPRREFLYVADMAEASLTIHELERKSYEAITQPMCSHVNIGTGVDVTIRELAERIKAVVGFSGKLIFDQNKPDGTMQKLLDVGRLNEIGYQATTCLQVGLELTYADFLKNILTMRT